LSRRVGSGKDRPRKCDVDAETHKIRELIGALSDAFWQKMRERQGEPGFSPLEHLLAHYEGECRAETPEEVAIWEELTKPQNYPALLRYVEDGKRRGVNDYAVRLYAALLEIAGRRWQGEHNQGE
jgi:hypothetical protein